MKKILIISVLIGVTAILQSNSLLLNEAKIKAPGIDMPDDVKAVIDKSCYGCHHKDSRNEKGKAKLQWDTLDELSKAKQVATMEGIIDVLKEDTMPPKKFKENYPDNIPAKEEIDKLIDWANAQVKKIMGE